MTMLGEISDSLRRIAEEKMNETAAILETVHEGIIALDGGGYIKHCNYAASEMLGTSKENLVKKHISRVMMKTPALEVLKSGRGYKDNDEIYCTDKGTFHFVVSAKPFYSGGTVAGAIICLRWPKEGKNPDCSIDCGTLKYTADDIIGKSKAIMTVKNLAALTAKSNSTVLITGESGTGKEMFAKVIHYLSTRAEGPFIHVNCGAIPENLIESELFGYERGAFTGADEKGKAGKFEQADGGTIFLDEIGDMPLRLQVKLLHVLQNMRFERIGGTRTIEADVRVIAATNKDLEKMISEGTFREDLYYRLSVIPLNIPPLRERKEDIEIMMRHFLKKYRTCMNKKIIGFTKEAKKIFIDYKWPGNVRELENAVEYGVNLTLGELIGTDAIPPRLLNKIESFETADGNLPLKEQIKAFEKEILLKKLKNCRNTRITKEKAARELGMSRATFYKKLEELGICD